MRTIEAGDTYPEILAEGDAEGVDSEDTTHPENEAEGDVDGEDSEDTTQPENEAEGNAEGEPLMPRTTIPRRKPRVMPKANQ